MNYLTSFRVKNHDFLIVSTPKGVRYFNNDSPAEMYDRLKLKDEEIVTGEAADEFNKEYIADISRYFDGHQQTFDWSFDLTGTEFQQDVWKELQSIQYGTTTTYGDVAANTGRPKAVRAAGGAIGRNPILIAIPCHRVIGKNGQLTGFSSGIPLKKELLTIESIPFKE